MTRKELIISTKKSAMESLVRVFIGIDFPLMDRLARISNYPDRQEAVGLSMSQAQNRLRGPYLRSLSIGFAQHLPMGLSDFARTYCETAKSDRIFQNLE